MIAFQGHFKSLNLKLNAYMPTNYLKSRSEESIFFHITTKVDTWTSQDTTGTLSAVGLCGQMRQKKIKLIIKIRMFPQKISRLRFLDDDESPGKFFFFSLRMYNIMDSMKHHEVLNEDLTSAGLRLNFQQHKDRKQVKS